MIPMANLAVIAMGVTAHLVIVTQVTNMVSGTPTIEKVTMVTNAVIGKAKKGSVDTQMKNTMANITVIAMVMISLHVIVTLVTNVVIMNPLEKEIN